MSSSSEPLIRQFWVVLQYAGNVVAPRAATLKSMLVLLCARANLPKDTELLVWEEVKYQDGLMINIMHQDRPLFSEQINNGDLLIVQEKLSEVRLVPHAPKCRAR